MNRKIIYMTIEKTSKNNMFDEESGIVHDLLQKLYRLDDKAEHRIDTQLIFAFFQQVAHLKFYENHSFIISCGYFNVKL